MAFHAALYDGKLGTTGQDDRNVIEGAAGPGVCDMGDLAVTSGSGMTTSVAAGRGYVRNTYAATQGGLWFVRNDGAVSAQHAGADASNPRVDTVGVRVYDSETGGDTSDVTTPFVVQGVATGAATLDNRTGAGTWPNNFLPLADVLIPAASGSITNANIRDRRPQAYALWPRGQMPGQNVNQGIQPEYPSGCSFVAFTLDNTHANVQFFMPVFLRRKCPLGRIEGKYLNGGTGLSGTYTMALYDSSGRGIVSMTTPGSFASIAGTAFTMIGSNATGWTTFAGSTYPGYFEAGMYWVGFGYGITAGAATIVAINNPATGFPGNSFLSSLGFGSAGVGGTAMPTTLSGMQAGASQTAYGPCPVFA